MNLLSPPASEAQWIESPTNDGNGCRFDSDPGQETKKAPEVRGFFNARIEHPINDGGRIISAEISPIDFHELETTVRTSPIHVPTLE